MLFITASPSVARGRVWGMALIILALVGYFTLQDTRARWAAEAEYEARCAEARPEGGCEVRDGVHCFELYYRSPERRDQSVVDPYHRCLEIGVEAYQRERRR